MSTKPQAKDYFVHTLGGIRVVLFKPLATGKYAWEEPYWRIVYDNRLHQKKFKTKQQALTYAKGTWGKRA